MEKGSILLSHKVWRHLETRWSFLVGFLKNGWDFWVGFALQDKRQKNNGAEVKNKLQKAKHCNNSIIHQGHSVNSIHSKPREEL
jgi:hypothetical protein